MKNELKTCLKGFLAIFIYLFSSIFLIEILYIFGIDITKLSDFSYEVINLIYEIILVALIVFIFRKTYIRDFKEYMKRPKKYLDEYIKYWILTLILMLLSNSLITYLTPNEIASNQETVVNTIKNFPIIMIILTIFVAPILEESIFRLSTRKLFPKSNLIYIFISGLLFGVMHIASETTLYGLLYIIPYSIPGFIFAYTYVKSDNIFVPISLHTIHNGALMILQILLLLK